MKKMTFLDLYNECVSSAVLGPEGGSTDNGSGQFSGDNYAKGDARTPNVVIPMARRLFGTVSGKTRRKKNRRSVIR